MKGAKRAWLALACKVQPKVLSEKKVVYKDPTPSIYGGEAFYSVKLGRMMWVLSDARLAPTIFPRKRSGKTIQRMSPDDNGKSRPRNAGQPRQKHDAGKQKMTRKKIRMTKKNKLNNE